MYDGVKNIPPSKERKDFVYSVFEKYFGKQEGIDLASRALFVLVDSGVEKGKWNGFQNLINMIGGSWRGDEPIMPVDEPLRSVCRETFDYYEKFVGING